MTEPSPAASSTAEPAGSTAVTAALLAPSVCRGSRGGVIILTAPPCLSLLKHQINEQGCAIK